MVILQSNIIIRIAGALPWNSAQFLKNANFKKKENFSVLTQITPCFYYGMMAAAGWPAVMTAAMYSEDITSQQPLMTAWYAVVGLCHIEHLRNTRLLCGWLNLCRWLRSKRSLHCRYLKKQSWITDVMIQVVCKQNEPHLEYRHARGCSRGWLLSFIFHFLRTSVEWWMIRWSLRTRSLVRDGLGH